MREEGVDWHSPRDVGNQGNFNIETNIRQELAQDGRVFLRVSNSYANDIEPGKMWNEGWSTKGAGRGMGLSGYRRILESYPNVCTHTGWENGVFVQEMTVEGQP